MTIIDKIKKAFENGEDFQFQEWDINELEDMKKTLLWYADKYNYKTYDDIPDSIEVNEYWIHEVDEDFGYKARKVLGIE